MIFLAVLVGFIPSFAWLLFYLREDVKRPEPKKMIAWAFLLGGLSTFLAFHLEILAESILNNFSVIKFSPSFFFTFAFIEELVKFLVVFWFIRGSRYFDEPIDAMVYLITAALGFAAVENMASAWWQWRDYSSFNFVFENLTLRFIGATLLHSLSSGILGYYWAKGWQYRSRFIFVFSGLIIASGAHALFNYLIISFGSVSVPTMFLLLIGLFVLNDFEKLKAFS